MLALVAALLVGAVVAVVLPDDPAGTAASAGTDGAGAPAESTTPPSGSASGSDGAAGSSSGGAAGSAGSSSAGSSSAGSSSAGSSSAGGSSAGGSEGAGTGTAGSDQAVVDDDLRAEFIMLAARDRGHDRVVPVDALPDAAQQVCGAIRADPTDATLEATAVSLQQSAFQLTEGLSWEFLDLASTIYCPEHHALVVQQIDARLE